MNKSPYLLIDFQDAAGVDMYKIDKCFKVIQKHIYLKKQIPLIDPSLFIESFCSKLDFGDKAR